MVWPCSHSNRFCLGQSEQFIYYGAGFTQQPIERHLAETTKMAPTDAHQYFEQVVQKPLCLFVLSFVSKMEEIKLNPLLEVCNIKVMLIVMLNGCFTSLRCTSCSFLSFSGHSACVICFVALSGYMTILLHTDAVCYAHIDNASWHQLGVKQTRPLFYFRIHLAMPSQTHKWACAQIYGEKHNIKHVFSLFLTFPEQWI